MKLILKKILPSSYQSFQVRRDRLPCLEEHWHFHPELELILILQGEGNRFVGNHVSTFQAGELALIGANLPHLWSNDAAKYQKHDEGHVDVMVIHFREDFLGESFFRHPEMQPIQKMIQRAQSGLLFSSQTFRQVADVVQLLPEQNDFDRIVHLLCILSKLSASHDYQLLCSPGYSALYDPTEQARLNRVYKFLLRHLGDAITLEMVAAQAHLSTWAFCRYFKQHTGKTYVHFLNELRIGQATKLLMQDDLSIAQIGYECGYRSLTHFNRQFKAYTGLTPRAYKYKRQRGH